MSFEEAHAQDSLFWFWCEAPGELGLRSNFGAMLRRLEGWEPTTVAHEVSGELLAAASRHREIRRALEDLEDPLPHVLHAAFGSPYPKKLERLGPVANVVPLTAAAKTAHLRSKTSKPITDWLERLCRKNDPKLYEIEGDARRLYEKAFSEFVRVFNG